MRRTHERRRLVPALLSALALGISACGQSSAGKRPSDGAAGGASTGPELFRRVRCDTCHGMELQGAPRMGPALAGLAQHWEREELAAYFLDPAPFRQSKPHLRHIAQGYFSHMRPFPELSPDERLALADWLLARP